MRFDKDNRNWTVDNTYNLGFLRGVQNHMNHLLDARGFVFLNDLYDALGAPRTKEGVTAGWVKEHGPVDLGDQVNHRAIIISDYINLQFNCARNIVDLAFAPPPPPPKDNYLLEVTCRFLTKSEEQAQYIAEFFSDAADLMQCESSRCDSEPIENVGASVVL